MPDGRPVIHFVRVDNQSSVGDDVIRSYIDVKPGSPLDVEKLEAGIQQLYGLDIFESVRYELVEEDGKQGLLLLAKEKSWGPGYVQAGMITSSNFEGDVAFRLGAIYTLTQINALNGEWRVGAQVGDEPGILTEIFQPLDPAARKFAFGKVSYETRNTHVYDADGHNTAKYHSRLYGLELGIGRQFGTWGEFRLGYIRKDGTTEVSTGSAAPDYSFSVGKGFVRLSGDTLDNPYFPTGGNYGVAEWQVSDRAIGSDNDYQQGRLWLLTAQTWRRDTVIGTINLATTLHDDAPIESLIRLGGFLNLSGFEADRLTGQHAGLAKVVYLRRINDVQRAKAYAGASLEWGNVWQDSGDVSFGDGIFAGSAFVGVDTPVGPIYLGYGRNDADEGSLYLVLGPLFSF